MHILFVEDDEIIASGVVYALQAEGWEVTHCTDVSGALQTLTEQEITLALLDLSLPDGSGYQIFEQIKKTSGVPVVFLTAADDEGNTVRALETGADDYIAKPFRVRELLARIKAVLRRAGDDSDGFMFLGNVKIDTAKAKVFVGNGEITLTAMEYRLLLAFAQNKGQVLTRKQILESLWDVAGNFVNDNTLTVYVKRLREKLEDDIQNPKLIQTVRGIGYKAGD
ncbi:MAG: response regulator transcription factor [Clostridiales bacterium]|nr:response regulator transcription factor [Clostridiales bacterium]